MDDSVRTFVDRDRLRTDIESTGAFGAVDADGHGRTNLTGSNANREAREYFRSQLEAAGLDVRVDPVGTVVGRYTPSEADPDAAPVAAGSHLDSVIEGGIFDGPLGVYSALEAVRAIDDGPFSPDRPIEVVCFTEEEGGRFADGLLGSSVAAGATSVSDALAFTDSEGTTLETALEDIGYRGEKTVTASDWDAWLELHVEQGTRLERAGVPAGVVTTVTGITHCHATIAGEADHAGSTPMATRTDALAAAGELIADTERAARTAAGLSPDHEANGNTDNGGTAVATIGHLDVRPDATNVIPGTVDLSFDIRDVEGDVIESLVEGTRTTLSTLEAERGVETAFERPFDVAPTPMADRCRDVLTRAADRMGIDAPALHSGAAHDTMYVARCTDAGMLFAPSRGGYSHSPREWTDWADCAAATGVLATAIADLAGVGSGSSG